MTTKLPEEVRSMSLLVVLALAGCSGVGEPRMARAGFAGLSDGMSKAEVRQVLGQPKEIEREGDAESWGYERNLYERGPFPHNSRADTRSAWLRFEGDELALSGRSMTRFDPVALDERTLAIAEAVFLHLFAHAEDWRGEGNSGLKVDRRFVNIQNGCPASLLVRLRAKTDTDVLSPFVISTQHYPDGKFIGGCYERRGDGSLYFSLTGLMEPRAGTVSVWCSVTWFDLAARGYRYTVCQRHGKWVVTAAKQTWLS